MRRTIDNMFGQSIRCCRCSPLGFVASYPSTPPRVPFLIYVLDSFYCAEPSFQRCDNDELHISARTCSSLFEKKFDLQADVTFTERLHVAGGGAMNSWKGKKGRRN